MSLENCSPARLMPLIHFHSYIDTSVPYLGGIGDGISDHYNPPLDSVITAWVSHNGCNSIGDTLTNNSVYTHVTWRNCSCGADINLYITQDGGHSWPGGNQTPVGDPVSQYISATDLMWEFFQQFTLNCNISKISSVSKETGKAYLCPNPSNDVIYIRNTEFINNFTIQIFSCSGELIYSSGNIDVIDLRPFQKGIYFAEIFTGKKSWVQKIVKQ
jgi:polyhydroxybutyrate depolymerase